jgi:bacteriocin biosynthesis cyclodehydratase domain-containing protein
MADVPLQPLLAPWWRTVEVEDRLLFEHAGRVVQLNGRAVRSLLPTLIPLLDGAHTVSKIVEILGETAEAPILKALSLLDDHGLLVEGPAAEDDVAACYVASVCAVAPGEVSAALTRARVAIFGSAVSGSEVERLLGAAGVRTESWASTDAAGPRAELVVAAPTAGEAQQLGDLNARCIEEGTPWLALLPSGGHFAAVGPLYVPGRTACHACYLVRRGAASGYESDFALLERRPVQAPTPAAASSVAAGLAALMCFRWLGAHDPTLPGAFYAVELQGTLACTRHRVLRVPRCRVCGVTSPPPSPWFRDLDA